MDMEGAFKEFNKKVWAPSSKAFREKHGIELISPGGIHSEVERLVGH